MFKLDPHDPQHALAKRMRMMCHACGRGFDSENGSAICPDCIVREPMPLQDNENEHCSTWIRPRESPQITVARFYWAEAALQSQRFFMATLFLHNMLTSIAGGPNKPLRLFPKEQAAFARHALELFAENFPDMLDQMDLNSFIESGTLWPKRGLE